MFNTVKKLVSDRFEVLRRAKLFDVDYDKDKIWEVYLNGFSEETRNEHRCNACRAFLRQAGGVVNITPDGELETLWDLQDVPEEYAASVAAVAAYVRSQSVTGYWTSIFAQVGVDKNRDPVRNVVWEHFHVPVPKVLRAGNGMDAASHLLRDNKVSLEKGLAEITPEAVTTVLELIDQGRDGLYRGPENRHLVAGFQDVLKKHLATPITPNGLWLVASTLPPAVAAIRSTLIGTLLTDLSEGEKDMEGAIASYENKASSGSYQRTTAPVTPRMIEDARKKLESLGYVSALHRRRLASTDITVANALFVHRTSAKADKDVFTNITEEAKVDPRRLDKVDTVTLADFIEKVIPTAKELRVLFEGRHLSNLVTLTGPDDPEAPGIFEWDNAFGWSYSGGLDDSIKERVKAAGGNVSGWMRISLSWSNHDDLDLHLFSFAGAHVFYGAKRDANLGAHLDVDMNAGHGTTRTPVENIIISKQLPAGRYEVKVRNYCRRENQFTGYTVEIENQGDVRTFASATSPGGLSYDNPIVINVAKDGTVDIEGQKFASSAAGVTKWGLTTGAWQRVKVATLSPNHWTRPTGPKHLFMMLKGCSSDEPTRPFLNAFLSSELKPHRKVMEVLGGKVEVSDAPGEEMSGLGFSSSKTDHFFVEVTSSFKRVLRVNI